MQTAAGCPTGCKQTLGGLFLQIPSCFLFAFSVSSLVKAFLAVIVILARDF